MSIITVQRANRTNYGRILGQLDMVLRFNDVSSWSISVPRDDVAIELAKPGSRILIEGYGADPISGPMNSADREYSSAGDRMIISGYTDEVYLFDRLVYPSEPVSASATAFSSDAYDLMNGVSETVMKTLVRKNATDDPAAWVNARSVDGLVVAPDVTRGTSVISRGRFQNLGEQIRAMALVGGGLGFQVSELEFDVYEPRDLTSQAVFDSSIGNMAGFRYSVTAPEATHFVVAGGGQAENRTFQLGGDDAAATKWNRRIEQLRDRRDTSEGDELAQQLEEEIFEKAEKVEVTMRPINTDQLKFGRDYFLGDRVTVQGVSAVLNQVEITFNENGETITPGVNTTSAASALAILSAYDAIRKLNRRVGGIERAA